MKIVICGRGWKFASKPSALHLMGRILTPNAHPRPIRIYSRSRRSTEFPVDQPRSDLVCVSSGFHEFPVVENRVTGHQGSEVVVHWKREVIDELNRVEWDA
jgi:hypothetical protein